MYQLRLALRYKHDVKNNRCFLCEQTELEAHSPTNTLRRNKKFDITTPRTNYGVQMLRDTIPSLLDSLARTGLDIYSCSLSHLRTFCLNLKP